MVTESLTDPLSQVLQRLEIKTRGGGNFFLTSPWGYQAPAEPGGYVLYVVRRGSAVLESAVLESSVVLCNGDAVLLSREVPYTLHDGSSRVVVPLEEIADRRADCSVAKDDQTAPGATWLLSVNFSLGGPLTGTVRSALGSLVHLRADEPSHDLWLQGMFKMLCIESNFIRAGSSFVNARLLELFFVQFLRASMEGRRCRDKPCDCNLLSVFFEPQLAKAMDLVHQYPERPWTVADLAAEASMSRTAFAVRFSELAGIPPLAYVTRWRMMRATELLRQGHTLEQVSGQVGYESEAAFARAFKREVGISPGSVRHQSPA